MSPGKKSSALVWNIFTWVTDTLLPWNKLCTCSHEKRSCYLPLLTDNKVKESCWLLELKVALPQKVDINGGWAISPRGPPLLNINALPQMLLLLLLLCISIAHFHISALFWKLKDFRLPQTDIIFSIWKKKKTTLPVFLIIHYLEYALGVWRMFAMPHESR